ncbi:MAG TPA: class I SAM-dependent methyltransferase [Candidatus Dormibacteraeota bacterium]|jgi:predicted RNA methylase|nr:class I SAM-dependent methyltransferase [Candidatus Dormibacteraeota bacterium]
MSDQSAVGQFIDVASAARRPRPRDELAAYGIVRRLRGATVLDIGTGDGRLAFGAASAGAALVVGIDPDPSALRAARRNARALALRNVSFRTGAAQDLPVPRGRFDIAILSWAL